MPRTSPRPAGPPPKLHFGTYSANYRGPVCPSGPASNGTAPTPRPRHAEPGPACGWNALRTETFHDKLKKLSRSAHSTPKLSTVRTATIENLREFERTNICLKTKAVGVIQNANKPPLLKPYSPQRKLNEFVPRKASTSNQSLKLT